MDVYLAVASKRDVKTYASRPLPAETAERILDAGRLAGSARNRQPWRFLIVENAELREQLAETVYAPDNVRGAALVVAVAASGKGPAGFDCGRAAQNMMLVAWDAGIGSSPNGLADPGRARTLLGLDEDEQLQIVLTFGYPARPRDPADRPAEAWSRAAQRRSLAETIRRL
jgi:nitroreductase